MCQHSILTLILLELISDQKGREELRECTNIVTRLNLPNMRFNPEQRVDVYADAVRGLRELEPEPEKILKFREPTHPGEMLMHEFLAPMSITQRELSKAIRVPYQRINEIVNGRRGITPSTALRLAKFFNMSEYFWMNMQLRWDLYHAKF